MPLYKDFNKEADDLVNKNFAWDKDTKAFVNAWKLESKLKGGKDSVFVNPQASSAGVSADFEYNTSSCGAKVKVSFGSDLKAKVKTTYEQSGHKLEATTNCAFDDLEVVYEGRIAGVSLNEKLTSKKGNMNYEGGASYSVASHCDVGAGAKYDFSKSALSWSAATRYLHNGYLLSVQTEALRKFTTGITAPLSIADRKVTVGAVVNCGGAKAGAKNCDVTVGVQTACFLNNANTVRVRINDSLKWAVAYSAKLGGWKSVFSFDASFKPAATFTLE